MAHVKAAYFWSLALLVTLFYFLCSMVAHTVVVLTGRQRDGRWVHQCASLWGRTLIWIMPGWRVTVKGVENVPPEGQAAVLVANHESMADIWGMFFLKTQFRWLSKASVFKIPMVGPAMKWAGYVPIERGERASHSNAMTAAADRLKMGLKMFYFPEGTRSSDGQIKPFKMGAFRLAQEAQVPVVPIAIHGAAELMTKGSGLPGRSHVHIIVLPALPPPAPNEASLPDYAERVRQSIIAVHADLT